MILSLNFACMGSFFRFPEGKLAELLVVYYEDFNSQISTRLPGGTVQFEDISNAFKAMIPQAENAYTAQLSKVYDDILYYKDSYNEGVEKLKSIGGFGKKELFFKINQLKNEKLVIIKNMINAYFSETSIKELIEKAKVITMTREVNEETDASYVGQMIQSSSSWVGPHEKCGMVSCDVNAPDSYRGSGDADIVASGWTPIKEALKGMYQGAQSSHYNVLQSGIRLALERKLHPKVEELREFLIATNE